jgi:hypothetical protein
MPTALLLFASLLTTQSNAALVPIAPPCSGVNWHSVDVFGPGPGESGVPLNASAWLRVRLNRDSTIEVSLRDGLTDEIIATRRETLYEWAHPADFSELREVGLRVIPEADLKPNHRYFVDWNVDGATGGHSFETGDARDETPPDPPVIKEVQALASVPTCVATFGVRVTPELLPDLLYLPLVQGEPAGLGRAGAVDVVVGQQQTQVVGGLLAMDLAGNRSATSAAFSGTTPTAIVTCSAGCSRSSGGGGVFSCASTGARGDLAVALLIIGAAASRARRPRSRGDNARGPKATSP